MYELRQLPLVYSMQARREEEGESFPGPSDVWGAPPSLKNTEKDVPDVVFLTSNMYKIHFRPGRRAGAPPRTDPAGELTMLPHTPSRIVRGHPSIRFLPSRRFWRLDLAPYGMKL